MTRLSAALLQNDAGKRVVISRGGPVRVPRGRKPEGIQVCRVSESSERRVYRGQGAQVTTGVKSRVFQQLSVANNFHRAEIWLALGPLGLDVMPKPPGF
jgi:hypothetical protein